MKRITGRLAEDKGKYYAVINLPTVDGKRKTKWHTLNLEAKKGNKKEAQYRLNQILDKYNAGDVHLAETMTHADRERNRLANTKMLDYLDEWLEGHQHDIERETYHQYKRYIDGRIREFFAPLDLTVKDLSGDEINEFYTYLRNAGLKGSTGQRYHGVLHKAFKDEVKRRIIPSNPVDQANRPRKEQMKKVMRSAYSKEYTDYVCVDALGKLYDPDFVTGHFGQLLKKHNLKKIRFHDLRHSCASVLLAQGVPMKQIQDWLGHSDMSTTVNIKNPYEQLKESKQLDFVFRGCRK